jgi:hypothetical protein
MKPADNFKHNQKGVEEFKKKTWRYIAGGPILNRTTESWRKR